MEKKNIVLNEGQKDVLEKLKNFVNNGDNYMVLLEGPAGSGKTTVITEFIHWLQTEAVFGHVAMVAPTNKAVKVLKEMCDSTSKDQIEFCSLHSLLGLKHKITKDGKEVYERDDKTISKLYLYDVVVIDEASMVSDQLFNELEDQNYRGVKIVFVGDRNQINPVNHEHAIPMLDDKRELFKISHFELTEIVRQAKDNPIIKYSQKIIKDDFNFKIGTKEMVDQSGIVMLNRNDMDVLKELYKYYFCNETFDNNANHCKVVAWRNATVDRYNDLIRFMKYGKVGRIVKNEKLIVDKPVKGESDDVIVFTTNEDLIVKTCSVQTKKLYDIEFQFYDCDVVGDENELQNIHILHEKSSAKYTQLLKKLADDAKNEKESFKKVEKWKKYFGFIDNFAQVKYNYAITCHSAQGSTYNNCFVDFSDICVNWNKEERKRILYTAFTRPKEMLYIM